MSKIVFNARYNSVQKIVDSFIGNDQYKDLLVNSNSILSGPRGCGKTTLLKMLTPEAVHLSKTKKQNLEYPDFIGIYIPADKQWLIQHQNIETRVKDKNKYEPIIVSLLNANVFVAILNSIKFLISIEQTSEDEKFNLEYKLIRKIKYLFEIPNSFPNDINSLKAYLYRLVNNLNASINKLYYSFINIEQIEYNFLSFTDCAILTDSIYEAYYTTAKEFAFRNGSTPKWALCFDELEISPNWLVKNIIKSNFRSTSQNLIFKLTATPNANFFDNEDYSVRAQVDHDFNIIPCWIYNPASGKKWKSFCLSYLKQKYNIDKPAEILSNHSFNDSLFYSERQLKGVTNYSDFRKGSILWKVLKDLANEDQELRNYLLKKGIDPENPIDNVLTSDAVHRKIKPLIAFRYYFGQSRSRKSATLLYYGVDHFIELTDGNPRALLRLINYFERYFKLKEKIPLNVQASQINKFSQSNYNDFIEDPQGYNNKDYSLKKLIDELGNSIHNSLVKEKFNPDPATSFTISERTSPSLQKLVNYGLELGVFQLLEDINLKPIKTITNKRIRITYRLYPFFNLPKRLYKEKSIEEILKSNTNYPNLFNNDN